MDGPIQMSPTAAVTSALVVGIERYQLTGAGADLAGSAKLAARFACWLVENGICYPERITLMTAHDEAAYTSGRHEPELSPEDDFRKLETLCELIESKVNRFSHADAAKDFGDWINGGHGPRGNDAFFLLFWVGHGFTHPQLLPPRLCLLGSDANDYQLDHVELTNLLDVVGQLAPGVHEIAFVNACRAPVPAGWAGRLQDGERPVTLPVGRTPAAAGSRPPVQQSIVYAAAHGQTTKMAGFQDRTFAEELLSRLTALPRGTGPLAVFDGLKDFGDQIGWQPFVTTFRYLHGRTERIDTPPQDDRDLTRKEWLRLLEIAQRIDRDPRLRTSWDVRLGAYCAAVTLEEVLGLDQGPPHPAVAPGTLEELIRRLRNRPSPDWALPPPLVVACEFVAHVPVPGSHKQLANSRKQLAKWCTAWASRRRPDGDARLDRAKARRWYQLPRDYLSILVDEVYASGGPLTVGRMPPSRRYRLSALLWAMPALVPLRGAGWGTGADPDGITADEVADAAARLIGQADRHPGVRDPLLLEFVLPRELLGRRLEYEGESPLGFNRPVVYRDLDRLRRVYKSTPQIRAQAIKERIDRFEPVGRARWSEKIEWFTCQQLARVRKTDIVTAVGDDETFCLALEHGDLRRVLQDGTGPDAPPELIYSVDAGAAVVVSLHYENQSDACVLRSSGPVAGGPVPCQILQGKRLVKRRVNDTGLSDLPYIARQIRSSLQQSGIQIGVLMEDRCRLWPSYELAQSAPAGKFKVTG
ncbi:MAG TPA: hypothetical protein VKU77_05010 [Streptosporangiaceae bacterium]|nr:hypothetical protein [Streptosporangiaceae bacterium]